MLKKLELIIAILEADKALTSTCSREDKQFLIFFAKFCSAVWFVETSNLKKLKKKTVTIATAVF